MKADQNQSCECNSESGPVPTSDAGLEMLPFFSEPAANEPCCGPPAGPPAGHYERPGYKICHFVAGFLSAHTGPVPRVKTKLGVKDQWGSFCVRLGLGRNNYKVAPGLYAVGEPDRQAPVLVTANYKLSFDHLRRQLGALNAWVLVLDTRGINVWCAAGKGTFDTAEVVRQVKRTALAQVVEHRRLILPQLGAVGVAAHEVKRGCGFEVVWGPIRARDLKAFLAGENKADEAMRRITFTFAERLILVPVELSLVGKYLVWAMAAVLVLSGIGSDFFSLTAAWHRGLQFATACLAGVLTGCVLTPVLLPWIPGRAFSLKGATLGLLVGVITAVGLDGGNDMGLWTSVALVLMAMALSSFLAMNFTGSTPFTSPSGVEKEMRRAIPLQLAAGLVAVALWVGAGFTG